MLGQEVPPLEGFAQYGVLGLVVIALGWFAWQSIKNLRADLVEARTELKDSRARELAMAEKMGTETATLLAQATSAIADSRARELAASEKLAAVTAALSTAVAALERMARRRGQG